MVWHQRVGLWAIALVGGALLLRYLDLLRRGRFESTAQQERERFANEMSAVVQACGSYLTVQAAFASVSAAVLFVVVGLITSGAGEHLEPFEQGLAGLCTVLLAVSTFAWLFSLEQVGHVISPARDARASQRIYREAMNLWSVGLVSLMVTLCLVILLAHGLLAACVIPAVGVMAWRHFNVLAAHAIDDQAAPAVGPGTAGTPSR